MKEIVLTQGKVALVDDQDYEYLSQWKWYAHKHHGNFYARMNSISDKKRITIRMHILLMSPEKGIKIDHIDGDGLNNQRNNLRSCTVAQNNANRKMRPCNKTGFKGVNSYHSKFKASIQVNYKQITIGIFDTAEEAANAYNRAALIHFGEFARLNKI